MLTMDPNAVTLILGISGSASTLIVAGLGLYFTARARSAPLREHLYEKQVDLVSDLLFAIGRSRVFAVMACDPESPYQERATEDLRDKVRVMSELCDTAAALLPTELYVEMNKTLDLTSEILGCVDEDRDGSPYLEKLAQQAAKAALVSRICLGIDELSQESLKLFARASHLEHVCKLTPKQIAPKVGCGKT